MSLLQEDVVVGGKTFRLQKFPALTGYLLLNRILRIATPPLAKAVSGAVLTSFKQLLSADLGNFAPALEMFFSSFTEAEQERLLKDLFAGVKWKNDKSEWSDLLPFLNEVFMGRLFGMVELQIAIIKFQFADFKDALIAAIGAVSQEAAPALQ